MSGVRSTRAGWFAALVAWVAIWPLVHRGLVARFEIDPWKLGGFAMYTTHQTTLVAVFQPTGGGLRRVDESTLPPRVRRALEDFRARQSALGRLVTPDAAVRALHAARPELVNLVVVVQRLWLDRATARIAQAKRTYLYESGERFEPLGGAGPVIF